MARTKQTARKMAAASPKKRKAEDFPTQSSSEASSSNTTIFSKIDPQYIKEREELEVVRIDALYKIDEEKRRNQQKKKEIEILEKLNGNKMEDQDATDPNTDNKVKEILRSGEDILKLMVGGKMFVTSRSTIDKRDNMIKTMLSSGFDVDRDENGCILLNESNPDYFPIILEHLRTGSTTYVGLWESANDDNIDKLKTLLMESDFFGTNKLSAKVAELIKAYNANQKSENTEESQEQTQQTAKRVSKHSTLDTNQNESDEKWLEMFSKLTLKEKTVMEEFLKKEELTIEKERQDLRQREASLKKEPVTFNVRGVKFCIGIEKLLVHPESIFPQLIQASTKNEIFLDRDSEVFSVLYEYLESGTFNSVPKEMSQRKLVYKEAKEFKLQGLLDFLDPLRYPIEEIGTKNLKIKKEEDFLRGLYVSDRENPILADPYLHLVSVFGTEHGTRELLRPCDPPSSVPLLFDFENPVECSELINEYSRLKLPPVPEIVSDREEFYTQFNALTCGLFKDMDWSNVFAAGGGILACMLKAKLHRTDLLVEESRRSRFSKFKSSNDFVAPQQQKKKVLWEEDDGSESENDNGTVAEGYFSATSSEDERPAVVLKEPKSLTTELSDLDEELFNYFRKSYWKNSDIDLFIYGLTEKEAEQKIKYLFELFQKNIKNIPDYAKNSAAQAKPTKYIKSAKASPAKGFGGSSVEQTTPEPLDDHNDILLIRTENAITFKFINSVRTVQVILRIYKNPAEVLMGFDVNCCCVGFDGSQVYALPRAIQAIKTRCNIVDVDRQSTTYELRLVKYALRGFRIGVAGYEEKRVQNDILIKDHFYKHPRRRWYSQNQPQPLARLQNVTGLAKVLLIRHSYKHSKFRAGLKSIGGGDNIESAELMVSKSKFHDYTQIRIPRYFYWGASPTFVSASQLFDHIKKRTEYVLNEKHMKLFFEYALNDINGIIQPKEPKSDLPPHLEFIVYEPTRQYVVGSFHPHTRNFFRDAYVDEYTEAKAIGKKKFYKYKWGIQARRYTRQYSEKESIQIEEAYRIYKNQKSKKDCRYELSDGDVINFNNMRLEKKMHTWQTLNVKRTRESFIFVKRAKDDQLTNIHEVLDDQEEEKEVEKVEESSSEDDDTKKPSKTLKSAKASAIPSKKLVTKDESESSEEVPKKKYPTKSIEKYPTKSIAKKKDDMDESSEEEDVPKKKYPTKSIAKKK